MASVFTSVLNISPLPSSVASGPDICSRSWTPAAAGLACRGFRGSIVSYRRSQRERGAAPHLAGDRNRAVELFDDPFGNGQAKPQTPALRGDEVVKDRREALRRNPGSCVGHADLRVIPGSRRRNRDLSALGGGLNRVGDQIAVDAAEREAVAVNDQRLGRVARLDRDAVA